MSLGPSLDRLTRALGAPGADGLAALFTGWEDIVGERVASHTRPISLAGGVLVLAVDQPAWASHLSFLEHDLRARVEAVVGAGSVRRVELRVRPR